MAKNLWITSEFEGVEPAFGYAAFGFARSPQSAVLLAAPFRVGLRMFQKTRKIEKV